MGVFKFFPPWWCCFTPLEFILGGLAFWVGWPHIYGASCIFSDVSFRAIGAIVVYRFKEIYYFSFF